MYLQQHETSKVGSHRLRQSLLANDAPLDSGVYPNDSALVPDRQTNAVLVPGGRTDTVLDGDGAVMVVVLVLASATRHQPGPRPAATDS